MNTLTRVAAAARKFFSDGLASAGVVNKGDAIAAPAANVTYAANGAGVLTGSYFYLITYVTAAGETAPWIGQATPVALTSQQMRVTLAAAPAGVTARRLYRSVAGGSASDRAVFFLTEVAGAAATTYGDNAADGALGAAPSWTAANRGYFTDGVAAVPTVRFSDQATTLGQGAGGPTPSYALTAVGYRAGANQSGATRNSLFGVYAGENITNGRENSLFGVHAGNALTNSVGCSFFGYQAGSTTRPHGNFNCAFGEETMGGTGTNLYGTYCAAFGFRALKDAGASLSRLAAFGPFAGQYADIASQLFVDNQDRGSAAAGKTDSLIYGVGNATMPSQTLAFNAAVRAGGKVTVSQLPAASAALAGHRFVVTDGSVAYASANVGATVAGGGANVVPVFCNGTNWVIG